MAPTPTSSTISSLSECKEMSVSSSSITQPTDYQPRQTTSGSSIQSVWSRNASGAPSHQIVFPFFGGEDDRFALRFVLQLARNDQVTATIIQMSGLQSTFTSAARDRQPDIVFFETLHDTVPEVPEGNASSSSIPRSRRLSVTRANWLSLLCGVN